MKIKLSKSQWQFIGKKAGWMKTAEEMEERYCKTCKKCIGKMSFEAWDDAGGCCDKCKGKGNQQKKDEPVKASVEVGLNKKASNISQKIDEYVQKEKLSAKQESAGEYPNVNGMDQAIIAGKLWAVLAVALNAIDAAVDSGIKSSSPVIAEIGADTIIEKIIKLRQGQSNKDQI